ncbi:DUF4942 domain-containing protein [Pectobacterium parmentieri]|uniref:DUF4942 domain-containing protein n=1 Tax=Pectobacterium parmentieri TaxID=1905730 RepID=UPI0039F25D63
MVLLHLWEISQNKHHPRSNDNLNFNARLYKRAFSFLVDRSILFSEANILSTFKSLHQSKQEIFVCGEVNVFKGLLWDYTLPSLLLCQKKICPCLYWVGVHI